MFKSTYVERDALFFKSFKKRSVENSSKFGNKNMLTQQYSIYCKNYTTRRNILEDLVCFLNNQPSVASVVALVLTAALRTVIRDVIKPRKNVLVHGAEISWL
jgi:hypothetical protein